MHTNEKCNKTGLHNQRIIHTVAWILQLNLTLQLEGGGRDKDNSINKAV